MKNLALVHQSDLSSKSNSSHSPYINKLFIAADKLFLFISQIKRGKHLDDIGKLEKDLLEALQSFQHKASQLGYDKDSLLISSYALCATLDELIKIKGSSTGLQWNSILLRRLGQEDEKEERFFVVLKRALMTPNKLMDAIEIMYICLSLGFQGKFSMAGDEKELRDLMETAYQTIRDYRGDRDNKLSHFFIKDPVETSRPQQKKSFRTTLLASTAAILFLLAFYVGFNYLLTVNSDQLSHQLTSTLSSPVQKTEPA